MTIVLKKKSTTKDISEAFEKIKQNRLPFDPSKFSGKLKRGLDGLKYQKQMRHEWK